MLFIYQKRPFLFPLSVITNKTVMPIISFGFQRPRDNVLANSGYITGFVNLVDDVSTTSLPSSAEFTFFSFLSSVFFSMAQASLSAHIRLDLLNWEILKLINETNAVSTLIVRRILGLRRRYLLTYAQRRVCARMQSWFTTHFWTVINFNKFDTYRHSFFNVSYTYRHLHRSDMYKAGLALNHPNFYLFVYILSNPYFWVTLQQTLNSFHRFK